MLKKVKGCWKSQENEEECVTIVATGWRRGYEDEELEKKTKNKDKAFKIVKGWWKCQENEELNG